MTHTGQERTFDSVCLPFCYREGETLEMQKPLHLKNNVGATEVRLVQVPLKQLQ
jgi:hypothetical protein